MSEAKRYEIATLQDFAKIPDDRIEACLDDFKKWLPVMRGWMGLIDALSEGVDLQGRPALNVSRFIWVDDGKDEITFQIKVAETSETVLEAKYTDSPEDQGARQ